MYQLLPWFVEALVATLAGAFLIGIVYIIKLLVAVKRALDHLGPSMETVYMLYPYILRTLGHQNDALKEVGANGSTDLANDCITAAEQILEKRHAALEGRLGRCKE